MIVRTSPTLDKIASKPLVATSKDLFAISKFGLLTIRRHSATSKHLLLYPQGDRSGLRKPTSRVITANTSIYFPTSVSTDLNDFNSVLTYPTGKDGVRGLSM